MSATHVMLTSLLSLCQKLLQLVKMFNSFDETLTKKNNFAQFSGTRHLSITIAGSAT